MNKNFVCFIVLVLVFVFAGLKYTQAQSSTKANVSKGSEGHVSSNLNESQSDTIKVYDVEKKVFVEVQKVQNTDEYWKEKLTDQEYYIAFKQGTERPFTGALNKNKKKGVYRSKVSGNDLFHSDHKFDSGTGWPSFFQPVDERNIILKEDNSLFMKRTEVVDSVSGAHLGHVFKDGPKPTGLRYCINSDALEFVEGVEYEEPNE